MAEAIENIEIKLMEADDEPGLMDFLRGNLDTFEEFERFWKWRQDNVSESGGEDVAIALEGDNVVGGVGIVPVSVTANGYPIRAAWQQDSLVSSDMRGRGLGKKLVEKAAEGCELVIAKGTSEAMYGLRKSAGSVDVSNSGYMVRVCKPRSRKTTFKKLVGEYVLWIWKKVLLLPAIEPGIGVTRIESFDSSVDILADHISKENVIRVRKDQRYLNWRYALCLGREYGIFKAGDSEERGAVIVRVSGPLRDEGWIVDLICRRDDMKRGYALIHEGIRYLETQGVSRIWVFTTLASTRKWFLRFGFVPTKFTPRFTYRIENKEIEEKIRGAEWDFWHGDGDVELYQ